MAAAPFNQSTRCGTLMLELIVLPQTASRPQTMAFNQTDGSFQTTSCMPQTTVSRIMPHTTVPQCMPHTTVSPPSYMTQTTVSPHSLMPRTTVLPHTIDCDQAHVSPPIVVVAMTGVPAHHAPIGTAGSSLLARNAAPAALIAPRPCVSVSMPLSGMAVNSRMALTRCGVSGLEKVLRFASSTSAATPLAMAVAMLVPLRRKNRTESPATVMRRSGRSLYRELPIAAADTSPLPGATRSGFASPSYHVGPREL